VNVRVICATNKNLAKLVENGKFREDLYYRVRVIHLNIPTLKERREDIPLLVDHLLTKFNHLQEKAIAGVSVEAMALLMEYDYPGNVRELENIIEQAFVLCKGEMIDVHHLPLDMRPIGVPSTSNMGPVNLVAVGKRVITDTLHRYGGNRKLAARELGINTSTLYRKIRDLNIEKPEKDGRSRKI